MKFVELTRVSGVEPLREEECILANGGYRHGAWDEVIHDVKISIVNNIAIAQNFAVLIAIIINSPGARIYQSLSQNAKANAKG